MSPAIDHTKSKSVNSRRRYRSSQRLILRRAATQACAQAIQFLFSTLMGPKNSKDEQAHWEEDETTAMVNFLLQFHSTCTGANFKDHELNLCAEHLRPLFHGKGGAKTALMIARKMSAVSNDNQSLLITNRTTMTAQSSIQGCCGVD